MNRPALNSTVLALILVLEPAVWARAQSPITQNNLLQSGGFDSGQAPWSVFAQGQYLPDYIIETAANLSFPMVWTAVFTNVAATPPFLWSDPCASNEPGRFYRVRLAP